MTWGPGFVSLIAPYVRDPVKAAIVLARRARRNGNGFVFAQFIYGADVGLPFDAWTITTSIADLPLHAVAR